jgi:hypothetical protein
MLALILPWFAFLAMQTPPPAETPRAPALPKKLLELVDRARSVPPEFAADALLRVAESDAVADPGAKRELIAEAFRKAGTAQEPMKRNSLKPGGGDTRVSFQARAYAQDLDVLSLESRAVSDMLRVDKTKARELFGQITPPRVSKLACADTLVYDVSAYYESMAEIAASAFTPKERAEEQHVKFLAGFAAGISSAAEVGPMAKALSAVSLTPEQLQMAATAFGGALKSMATDDRSFSSSVSSAGTMLPEVASLLKAARQKQVATPALVEAVRGYLARHLSGKRCADTGGLTVTVGIAGGSSQPELPDAVTFFNTRIRGDVYPAESVIPPLAGDEIRAASVEDPVEQDTPPKSAEMQELVDRYNGLLFNPLGTGWTSEQKTDTVWQSKLREYLAALSAWKPDQEMKSSGYFYRKCYLLSSLVNVVPNGPSRELVLRAYMDFLQQSGYQQGSRIEWFLPVNTLLFRVLTDPALTGMAEEMRNSGDAVIALYAQLDTVLPRSPAKVMGLL